MNTTMASRHLRHSNRHSRVVAATLASLVCMAPVGGAVLAAGCEGQNATSDAGGRSLDLAVRTQDEVVERARNGAGVGVTPLYGGVAGSASTLKHDGYRLKTPVAQTDCTGTAIAPITRLQGFETNTWSASGVGEIDVSRQFGLPPTSLLKLGMGVGGKWLETTYRGGIRTPSSFSPTVGVNAGGGKIEEDGIQLDFYSLLTSGTSYVVVATSMGFGDSNVRNASFTGLEFVGAPGGATRVATFGGGTGKTDYRDYTVQAVIGNVFTLGTHGNARTLLDLSGGLLYARYERDSFADSAGVRFGDASTSEFAGKLEAKLAYQMAFGGDSITPYLKAGVKHRFSYDSDSSVFNPTTGLCAVTTAGRCDFSASFDVKSDNTFWRAGGGLGFTMAGGKTTGVIEVMHQGSGDSNETIGKGQLIFRLN